MDDKFLINTLIIMAGIESKQPGAMPLEDNPLFVAAERLKELDALKAQVEQLREQLEYMAQQHRCGCGHPACNRCYDDKQNAIVLEAKPAQCLAARDAEIIAQAVADAVNAHPDKIAYIEHYGQTRSRGDYCDLWLSSSDLIQYANQLRQQAAKGE